MAWEEISSSSTSRGATRGSILPWPRAAVLAFPPMGRKRPLRITIGQSPRPDILDEMRPWWEGASLDVGNTEPMPRNLAEKRMVAAAVAHVL